MKEDSSAGTPPETMSDQSPENRHFLQRLAERLFGSGQSGAGDSVLRLLTFIWFMVALGLASLAVPALTTLDAPQALQVIGTGLFLAGAAIACGSMLGFLFGVPKIAGNSEKTEPKDLESRVSYTPNTNFELISDWLTKVIVGAGLVEIRSIVGWIDQIGQTAGAAMGGGDFMRVVATSFLIHNLLMGFFQGFLVAYIYLPQVFVAGRQYLANERRAPQRDPEQ